MSTRPQEEKFRCRARPTALKRQRLEIIKDIDSTTQIQQELLESASTAHVKDGLLETSDVTGCIFVDKATQVHIQPHYRSKSTQYNVQGKNIATSPIQLGHSVAVATSPFKVTPLKEKPSCAVTKVVKTLNYKKRISDSESTSLALSATQTMTSDTSLNEQLNKVDEKEQAEMYFRRTVQLIKKQPRFYIGVPLNCYYLVNILSKSSNISEEHILLCLKKIRLNTTFMELGDNFGITSSYAAKLFARNVPKIAAYLKPFIKFPSKTSIKRNLPIAFRCKYSNVTCIIDCLEIEIQKPSKSLHQAFTWSEYKKRNTIKYLISCTPDGLVNYISPGYGGRISDVVLVETCGFLNMLEPGSCLLADRGFKHLEPVLLQKSFQLVRPPSVSAGEKLSKEAAKLTKQVASLRIHVERVIRRVREFSMLKGHSVVNHSLIYLLDHIILIACALINIQGPIIH